MNSKGKKRIISGRHSNHSDPASNFVNGLGNMLVEAGLKMLAPYVSTVFGLQSSQLELVKRQLEMQNLTADMAEAREREASSENNVKLGELKVEEKEIQLDKAKHSSSNPVVARTDVTVRIRTEVISGALEIGANADGFGDSVEQKDAYEWAQGFKVGKVMAILGRRGAGKTAMAAKIGEFCAAVHHMPVFWLGLPPEAQAHLPTWIKIIDDLEQCPNNGVVICDETGLEFLSLNFTKNKNVYLRRLLFIARQKRLIFVFATQHSKDIEASIIRMVDCIIFKEPSLTQPENERREILVMAKRAASAFKQIPNERRIAAAYVIDDKYEGIIETKLPTFWSEPLSNIYANLNPADPSSHPRQLTAGPNANGQTCNESELCQRIRELRRTHTLREIVDITGRKMWIVRKCLGKM